MSTRYLLKKSIDLVYFVADKNEDIISSNELFKEYTSHIRPKNALELMCDDSDVEDYKESINRAKGITPLPIRLYSKTKQKSGSAKWILWNIYYIIESFHFIGVPLVDVTSKSSYEYEKQKKILEEFRFMLSHELRQPLTSVSGLVKLLIDNDSEDKLELLQMLEDSVNKLDESINLLMDKAQKDI